MLELNTKALKMCAILEYSKKLFECQVSDMNIEMSCLLRLPPVSMLCFLHQDIYIRSRKVVVSLKLSIVVV